MIIYIYIINSNSWNFIALRKNVGWMYYNDFKLSISIPCLK